MPNQTRQRPSSYDSADVDLALRGDSAVMTALRNVVTALGPLDVNLSVHGEPGTGKQALARFLHRQSSRRDDPFFAVSVAGMGEAQARQHLFGPVGIIRQAARAGRATLYLQALDTWPAQLQLDLAEALAMPELGGVRLVAGTAHALDDQFQVGRVQPALLACLATIRLSMPPLRARPEDIAAITTAGLARWSERSGKPSQILGAGAVDELLDYHWPGNVRELLCFLSLVSDGIRGTQIRADRIRGALRARPRRALAKEIVPLDRLEQAYLLSAIQRCEGNKSLAARRLGIGRNTLLRRLQASGHGRTTDGRRYRSANGSRWSPPPCFLDAVPAQP